MYFCWLRNENMNFHKSSSMWQLTAKIHILWLVLTSGTMQAAHDGLGLRNKLPQPSLLYHQRQWMNCHQNASVWLSLHHLACDIWHNNIHVSNSSFYLYLIMVDLYQNKSARTAIHFELSLSDYKQEPKNNWTHHSEGQEKLTNQSLLLKSA